MALICLQKNRTSKELLTAVVNPHKLPHPILWDADKTLKASWRLWLHSVMLCRHCKRQSTMNLNSLLLLKILNTLRLASLMPTIITKGLLLQNARFKMVVLTQTRHSLTEQLIGNLRCVTPSQRFSRPTRTTIPLATSLQTRTTSTCTPRKTIWVSACRISTALTPTRRTS